MCIRLPPISAGQMKNIFLVVQSTNIKRDEINIMNFINDITFNLHNSLLNYDNRDTKVTPKSNLIGIAR